MIGKHLLSSTNVHMTDLLAEYTRAFADTGEQFQHTFANLNDHQFNWRPAPDRWSIAQVIDHIIKTNESYYPVFDSIVQGTLQTPFIGNIPFIPTLIGNMLLNALNPSNQKKTKTFPIWEPETKEILSALDLLASHHRHFLQRLNELGSFFDKGLIISSPANKNVVYSLDKAIEIIIVHERRHFLQAKEILNELHEGEPILSPQS